MIQNKSISGCTINIYARNVTIRNVKMVLAAPQMWAINVYRGGSATIDHVDIAGTNRGTGSVEYAVLSMSGSPVRITHSNLHNCADCIQGEHVIVAGNYIHSLADPPGAHIDGIQCNASCGISVTGNTILNSYGQTSAVALFGDFGTPSNSTISNNLLAGGGYTVYGGNSQSTGIHITNNRFSRVYFYRSGQWGPLAHFNPAGTGNTWTGNIWDNTGMPIGR